MTIFNTACARDDQAHGNEHEEIEEKWNCQVCTYINHSETKCAMCDNERQPKCEGNGGAEQSDMDASCSDHDEIEIIAKSSQSSKSRENEFDDVDDAWNDEDLAAIDTQTQLHAKVSQSPDSTTHCSPTKNCMSRECKTNTPHKASMTDLHILSFSVSKNSGRISLHLSSSGNALHVNFDLSQVLTKECADSLEDVQLRRKAHNSSLSQTDYSFDECAVRQVLAALDDERMLPPFISFRTSLPKMCQELTLFVNTFLSLREVEKKAVRESGQALTAKSLKQKLLVSTVTGSTERYGGGAKEQARENMKNNCATEIDRAVINGKACAWCGKHLIWTVGATYCSQTCVEEGRIRRGGMYSSTKIREQLFALEHGKCQKCGVNAHSLYCRVKALAPAERLNALLNSKWKLPKTRQATDRLLSEPKEHDFWQADHTVAVAEGGGSTGLDNLRTLCTPCHSVETEQLLARLKTLPDLQSKDSNQMNIMNAFSNMKGKSSQTKQQKRKRRRVAD